MPVTSYSRTPASNNAAPPNGAPEGMTPGSVNNTIRQIMTDVVNEAGKGSAKVLGSVVGTNTITAGMSPALDAYTAGMIVVFTPANSNSAPATINIDSLGALDIQKYAGEALASGDLVVGIPAQMILDSGADDFILLNPQTGGKSGTFTGTLTGMSGATTGTVNYRISNNVCTLWVDSTILGTSNTTAMTMTGVPSACQPALARIVGCMGVTNNNLSNSYIFNASISGGTVTFRVYDSVGALMSTSAFSNSGSKGLTTGWSITYPL